MILEVECITVLRACLFLFILNELVCDHGLKKASGGQRRRLPSSGFRLQDWPLSLQWCDSFPPFILLSVFKRKNFPSGKFQIQNFKFHIKKLKGKGQKGIFF